MKHITLLVLGILTASCTKQDCCDTLPFFPQITILDSNNRDLLDPENENFYDHSKISIKSEESLLKNLQLEIKKVILNDSDSGKYRIYVENILPNNGSMKFYLRLNDTEIDTINIQVENSRTTRLELNGKEWIEQNPIDFTYVIRK